MLNSGNNNRELNWLLSSPRVKRGQSDCNPWMSKMGAAEPLMVLRFMLTMPKNKWCMCNNASTVCQLKILKVLIILY
jgi:hypothetical protein